MKKRVIEPEHKNQAMKHLIFAEKIVLSSMKQNYESMCFYKDVMTIVREDKSKLDQYLETEGQKFHYANSKVDYEEKLKEIQAAISQMREEGETLKDEFKVQKVFDSIQGCDQEIIHFHLNLQ